MIKKIQRLLSLALILLVVITAILGISLTLDLISGQSAIEVATKLLKVFGITAIAAGAIIAVLHINKDR